MRAASFSTFWKKLEPTLYNGAVNADQPPVRDRPLKSEEWYERQKSRERLKLIGLLAIAALILVIAFLRFGKTIPWGAR